MLTTGEPISYSVPLLTGKVRNQVDQVWNASWSGGISNPLEVIEQITYLLFLRRLDDSRRHPLDDGVILPAEAETGDTFTLIAAMFASSFWAQAPISASAAASLAGTEKAARTIVNTEPTRKRDCCRRAQRPLLQRHHEETASQ